MVKIVQAQKPNCITVSTAVRKYKVINKEAILFAILILNASRIREDSYNHIAAAEAINDNIDNMYPLDFKRFYTKTLAEAAKEACVKENVPFLKIPVYLALHNTRNEIIDWATTISFYVDEGFIPSPKAAK